MFLNGQNKFWFQQAGTEVLFSSKTLKRSTYFLFFVVVFMSRKKLIVGQDQPKVLIRTINYIFVYEKLAYQIHINTTSNLLEELSFIGIRKEDLYRRLGWSKWLTRDTKYRERRVNVRINHISFNLHQMMSVSPGKLNDTLINVSQFPLYLNLKKPLNVYVLKMSFFLLYIAHITFNNPHAKFWQPLTRDMKKFGLR